MDNEPKELSKEKICTSLTYVEEAFFSIIDGQKTLKKVVTYDGSEGLPKTIPNDVIVLLENYKSSFERGIKDPLKGKDVIVILLGGKPKIFPLDELESLGAFLYSLGSSISSKRGQQC